MNLAMMCAANRNSKFVAHLASKCAVLRKSKMVHIGRVAPTNQAGVRGDEFEMGLVPHPRGFGKGKCTLFYSAGSRGTGAHSRQRLACAGLQTARFYIRSAGAADACHPRLKRLFNEASISRHQAVLGRQDSTGPARCDVG